MMEIANNQFKVPSFEEAALPVKALEKVSSATALPALVSEVNVSQERVVDEVESSSATLKDAVVQINSHVQNLQRNLQFTVDEESGKDVVIVTDSESNEVIRQIPSEEALELARRLAEDEEASVYLINERA